MTGLGGNFYTVSKAKVVLALVLVVEFYREVYHLFQFVLHRNIYKWWVILVLLEVKI